MSFFFKDELQIQPTELALLTGIALSPWVVKPLYVAMANQSNSWCLYVHYMSCALPFVLTMSLGAAHPL